MPNKKDNDSNKVLSEYLAQEEVRVILTDLALYVNKDPKKLQYLKSTIIPMLDILIFTCNADKDDNFITVNVESPLGVKLDDEDEHYKDSPLLNFAYDREVKFDVLTNATYTD